MKLDVDVLSVRLTQSILAHQKTTLFVVVLIFLLSLVGVSRLTFSNDYRIFFSDSNPELKDLNAFKEVYGQSDSIFVVIHNPHGSIFSENIIPDIEALVEQAKDIEYVVRVEAITNFPDVLIDNDQLTVQALVNNSLSMETEDYLRIQAQALANPIINGGLLSPTADTTAINIIFSFPQESPMEVLDAAESVRELTAQFNDNHPEIKTGLSGIVMLNAAFSETGIHDLIYLLPIMSIVLFGVCVLLMRSIYSTIAIFITIIYSCIFALGVAGFFSIPITVVSVSSMIIIMTLAVANAMHLLVSMISMIGTDSSQDKASLIIEITKVNFMPVFLTNLTTIISFLTLNYSDVPPYWHLGNITSLGVLAAWILSFTLLPILMQGVSMAHHSVKHNDAQEARMVNAGEWVLRHYRMVILATLLVSAVIISAVPSLKFNDQFINYFSKNIEFRRDAEFMEANLSGLYAIEYLVPAREIDGIFRTEYLQNLDAYTEWLKQQKEVTHVYSYTDIIKRINWTMNHQDETAWAIPDDEDVAAQYFLMYELSLADDNSLENRISLDKSSTRLSVMVKNLSSTEMQDFVERSAAWQKANMPEYMLSNPTGPAVMFAYISKRNISSMNSGNAVSILLNGLIMFILLRSLWLGALSIIVNILPLLMMFGIWAMAVGEVGMVGTTISSAAMGIIVDNSIHFLTKYMRVKNEKGVTRKEALIATFRMVGVSIFATSMIIVAGLSVLIASDFQLNQQAGLLTVITIVLSLIFNLVVLPAAIMLFNKKEPVSIPVSDADSAA